MSKIRLIPGLPVEGPIPMPTPEGVIRNNTNSNTSIPPHPPVLCSAVLADGKEDSWLEYIPETLPEHPALVISCHGGGANAGMQFEETSWWCIAEKEGIIAVFPNAGGQQRSWLAEYSPSTGGGRADMLNIFKGTDDGRASEENHHIKFVKALIEEMKKKYNIDESRIYMQGMSMGDIMTMMFSRVCGNLLAAADSTAGPSPEVALFNEDGSLRGYKCPVPIYQVRGELDAIAVSVPEGREGNYTRQDINAANRKFWLKVNECDNLPRLAIRGVNNFAFYSGKQANVVYRDVKHRGHGQTLDDAQWAWETLFKGARRNPDGSVTCRDTEFTAGDKGAIALCEGAEYVYVNNQKVRIEAPVSSEALYDFNFDTHQMDEVKRDLYVPVSALEPIFGAKVQLTQNGRGAVINTGCEELEIVMESVACLRNGFLESMFMPVKQKDGVLCVALRWFAQQVYNLFVAECDGAMYAADHPGEMTKDMAVIIKEILA